MKKRSWDEEDEDEDEDDVAKRRTRNRSATEARFWETYRTSRNEHNASEAMIHATKVAHAYDEKYGLDRHTVDMNQDAVSDSKRRNKPWDSTDWPGGDLVAVVQFLNSNTAERANRPVELDWAGQEVDDFRLFVNAVDSGWLADAT